MTETLQKESVRGYHVGSGVQWLTVREMPKRNTCCQANSSNTEDFLQAYDSSQH